MKARKYMKDMKRLKVKDPNAAKQFYPYNWEWEHAVGGEFDMPWSKIDLMDRFTRVAMRDELSKHPPELLTYDQDIQWWTETETMMREGPFNASAWGPVSEYSFFSFNRKDQ